jgi:pre-mRNA-splicing factor ATP-dependent RNA helicase DHX15/PRP43
MSEPAAKRAKPSNNMNGGENPYLAHMSQSAAGGSSSSGSISGFNVSQMATGSNGGPVGVKNPLNGLVPRKVSVDQAKAIMVGLSLLVLLDGRALTGQDGDVNPFKNLAPWSAQYRKILEQRKGLPVYQKMQEFLSVFSENQITVMEGQTGSGKTTQIPQFVCYSDLPMLRGKMVACTQPRRVAAMSVAKRVADEMDGQSTSGKCREPGANTV